MVEVGLFLLVQWLRLDCSYMFSGTLDCSYMFSGSVGHLQPCPMSCHTKKLTPERFHLRSVSVYIGTHLAL